MKQILFAVLATFFAMPIATPLLGTTASAQTRDEQVRTDRENLVKDLTWYYDDLDKGLAAAKRKNKPVMVVLRCIP